MRFSSTYAGAETVLDQYRDRVCLIDDYAPGDGKAQASFLEAIVRFVGDGRGKTRSNAQLKTVPTRTMRGLVAATGEDMDGSESSKHRYLIVRLKNGDIDGRRLEAFQNQNHYRWVAHFPYFLQYISNHWNSLCSDINSKYDQIREHVKPKVGHGRAADIATALILTAAIWLRYVNEQCHIFDGTIARNILADWEARIVSVVQDSEAAAKGDDPARLYIQAVFFSYADGKCKLADDVAQYVNSPGNYLGYVEDQYWVLEPEKAFKLVQDFCHLSGQSYPLSKGQAQTSLLDAGLLKPHFDTRNGKKTATTVGKIGRKLPSGNRPFMLFLDHEKALDFLENGPNHNPGN